MAPISFFLLVFCHSVLHIDADHLRSIIFLKLSVAGHMTLFVMRTPRAFWRRPYPSAVLTSATLATQLIITLIVWSGFLVPSIPFVYIGAIWVYAAISMLLCDIGKRAINRWYGWTERSWTG